MINYINFQQQNNEEPLVSIVMPVYNASKYLVAALDSIVNQTYQNWELIAVDDASSDDSFLILKQYAAMDDRIKIYKNVTNLGLGGNTDKAISLAKGRFIAKMDADDISYPDRIEKQVRYLLLHDDMVAVGGQTRLIDEDGNVIGKKTFPTSPKDIYEMMYIAMPIQHPTIMIDRAKLPLNFKWYEGWKHAEDTYMFFKLTQYGKLANLNDTVLDYRYYFNSTSLRNAKKTFKYTYKARKIAEKEFDYVPTFKAKLISKMQLLAVAVLPNKIIPSVFKMVRDPLTILSMNFWKVEIENITNNKIAFKKSPKKVEQFIVN